MRTKNWYRKCSFGQHRCRTYYYQNAFNYRWIAVTECEVKSCPNHNATNTMPIGWKLTRISHTFLPDGLGL